MRCKSNTFYGMYRALSSGLDVSLDGARFGDMSGRCWYMGCSTSGMDVLVCHIRCHEQSAFIAVGDTSCMR
jgi:hypothetical protein